MLAETSAFIQLMAVSNITASSLEKAKQYLSRSSRATLDLMTKNIENKIDNFKKESGSYIRIEIVNKADNFEANLALIRSNFIKDDNDIMLTAKLLDHFEERLKPIFLLTCVYCLVTLFITGTKEFFETAPGQIQIWLLTLSIILCICCIPVFTKKTQLRNEPFISCYIPLILLTIYPIKIFANEQFCSKINLPIIEIIIILTTALPFIIFYAHIVLNGVPHLFKLNRLVKNYQKQMEDESNTRVFLGPNEY